MAVGPRDPTTMGRLRKLPVLRDRNGAAAAAFLSDMRLRATVAVEQLVILVNSARQQLTMIADELAVIRHNRKGDQE